MALKQPIRYLSARRDRNRSDTTAPALRIDAHQHFWHYKPEEFPWLQGDLECLRGDYRIEDLAFEMSCANVSGTVAVQARQTEAETAWLLELAAAREEVLGVVGWLPLSADDFSARLERFAGEPLLKGLRHIVQAEPDGFLSGAGFERGIRRLAGTGLVYDILILERQMREVIAFVDRHPGQSFVLDHLAKPCIATRKMEPWQSNLQELALRPNVTCKLSGMVTEAGRTWTSADLKPYFDVAVEAFTPGRLMVGSDWPVLTAHCTYRRWWQTVADWVAPLSQDEQSDILAKTALRVYSLQLPSSLITT